MSAQPVATPELQERMGEIVNEREQLMDDWLVANMKLGISLLEIRAALGEAARVTRDKLEALEQHILGLKAA